MTTPRPVTAVRAIKVRPDRHAELPDNVVTEEPMEIRAAGPGQEPVPVAVTMRTPGHDFELAAGFLVTERLAHPDEIAAVAYCDSLDLDEDARYNVVTVTIKRSWERAARSRDFPASASCGICGKTTIEDVELDCAPVPPAPPVPSGIIPSLPNRLRQRQQVFAKTGGLHAAGLFDCNGDLSCVREDVGRHNAVDKIAGHLVLGSPARLELPRSVLMVSGRVSFEIVQKAAACGIGLIAAVSAPSSLAVQAADHLGISLAGFVRKDTFNVYSHPERITFEG